MAEPDPIAARMHERAAERQRRAAERLDEAGMHDGAEAAKKIAREEEALAAEIDSPDPE
jgi:hypothetical protein